MTDFDLEIKKEFLEEALVNLVEVEDCFTKFETTADTKPLFSKMFFMAHNLKGGSLSVGFKDVAELSNKLENLVLKLQSNEISFSSEVVSAIHRSNGRLVEMISHLQSDYSVTFDNSDFLVDLQSILKSA